MKEGEKILGTIAGYDPAVLAELPLRNIILFEKLTVGQLVKKHHVCIEPDGSLPCSQQPATSPSPELS
jgi:hypothetical protein